MRITRYFIGEDIEEIDDQPEMYHDLEEVQKAVNDANSQDPEEELKLCVFKVTVKILKEVI